MCQSIRSFCIVCYLVFPAISQGAGLFSDIKGQVLKGAAGEKIKRAVEAIDDTKSTAEKSIELETVLRAAENRSEISRSIPALRKYSPKIIGGDPVAYRQYPWQVALIKNHPPYRQFCGGSLIRNNWVLTAAHCVDGGTLPSDFIVLAGTDFLDQGGQRHDVESIIKHENYVDAVQGFDVALLKLKTPSKETVIELVDQNTEQKLAFSGVLAWVTGWGITETGYPSIQLKDVDVRRIGNDACNSPQMYDGQITDTMICAGYRIGEKDSCQGDSGGPLVTTNQRGGMVQFGIVSWGEGCAVENRPGVYTRVAAMSDWLKSKISDN